MTHRIDTSLGELIHLFYQEFLAHYGDEDMASVATATAINDLLAENERADMLAQLEAA